MPVVFVEARLRTDQRGEAGFLEHVAAQFLDLVAGCNADKEEHEHEENLVAQFGDIEVFLGIRHL